MRNSKSPWRSGLCLIHGIEGYGVILEELDELWDEVKKHKPDVKNMRAEAVQVAAMAMKFIMSMENDWKPYSENRKSENLFKGNEEELRMIEQKCHQCLYDVMTNEALEKLGADPCDTCTDFSNWKPKED
ncbi:hypothetical protein [Desulfosporosinus sp. FKA]|uniref:hypothetical protein n=1 Tax=Desulfosporosinus sp. FKA TaxID=1969834 RepID=UPI000B4993DC|nr:hypothetical protein [Desulfosporosinus sp. FKA]